MIPRGRYPFAFITFSLIIAIVAVMAACTESPTPTPSPSPTPTATPTPDSIEQRLEQMVPEARLMRDALAQSVYGDVINTEIGSVLYAMDAAIADLPLGTVDARSTCNDFSSSGTCGLTGGTVPANFLYPNCLSTKTASGGLTYSWDATGFVTFDLGLPLNPDPRLPAIEALTKQLETELRLIKQALRYSADGIVPVTTGAVLGDIQAAIDAAIADLSLVAVDARYDCTDFSSTGRCGLTGGTVAADFLYPAYLRIQTAGDGRTYRWDRKGLVSLVEIDLDEREKVQAAIDAAIALRGLMSVDARSPAAQISALGVAADSPAAAAQPPSCTLHIFSSGSQ